MSLQMHLPDGKRKRERVRGVVVDNNDPLQLRMVRVSVPSIYGKADNAALPWANTSLLNTNGIGNTANEGTFGVLAIGAAVWLEFQEDMFGNDDHNFPLVTGLDLTPAVQKAEELVNYPARYGFKDAVGNVFWVDRQTKEAQVILFGHVNIHVDQNGNVVMTVDGNVTQTIKGNVVQEIDGTLNSTIKGAVTIDAQQAVTAHVGGNLQATVDGNTTLNCSQNTINGNLQVNGTIDSTGNIHSQADVIDSHGSLSQLRGHYNGHAHTGVQTGGGTSGGTTQPD